MEYICLIGQPKLTSAMQACFQGFVQNIFASIPVEVISNVEDRFLKISVHFQISYLENEVGDPHLFLHF